MLTEIIQAKVNVTIIARERGKIRRDLCRRGHNIWVNLGRQYLAEVISPLDNNYDKHYGEGTAVRVTKWMGLGIGSDEQTVDIAATYPTLDSHYPGQNLASDSVLSTAYLERPIKVSGTAGTGAAAGVWLKEVAAPPTFSGTPVHIVTFTTLFGNTDAHLGGSYPAVPLSECGLFLSDQQESLVSSQVYDYGNPPGYVNTSTRQLLIAYNGFAPLTKTPSVSLELNWEIQF